MPPEPPAPNRPSLRRLRDGLDQRALVTTWLAVSMVVLHIVAGVWDWSTGRCDVWGVLYGDRSREALILFGGRARDLVAHGEWWRLISCGWLHAGPLHLTLNVTALFGLGPMCEAVFGRVRTLALFLVAVVAGAILSQIGGAPLAIGASGGVFGMMGALGAFGLVRGRHLHAQLRRLFGRDLWPWVVLNLGIGLLVPGVDNLGHIGGLVAGSVFGVVSADFVTDNRRPTLARTRLLAGVSVAAITWAVLGAVSAAR